MKKVIMSLLVAISVVLASGCVSQDEYNSLVEENSNLKSQTAQLEDDLNGLREDKNDLVDCFDIYTTMLGLPKEAISEQKTINHGGGLDEEYVIYDDNGNLSSKDILTFPSNLSAEVVAPYIKVHMDGVKENIRQSFQYSLKAMICVYRYDNGNIIGSQCWYIGEDGGIKAPMNFPSYSRDVYDELSRLLEEE